MTPSSTCSTCGAPLYEDDVHCAKCGSRRPGRDPSSTPARGATRALAATSAAGSGEVATCPSCGEPKFADDPFCASCGISLDDQSPAPQESTTPQNPPAPAPSPTPPPPPTPAPAHSSASTPAPPEEEFDGWHEVRLQLEEAARGDFEIEQELGRGGMAAVYKAKDLALGRTVAIKVMAPGLLMGPGMVDRFRQEAVTVANLHHPNIVTIHTVRQAGHLHYFVMQAVEGASLEEILERPNPIPVFLVQATLYQLGVGLAYAHRRGVIHRDIKPGNVLMDKEGNAILTDFGIAKVTTASNLTQTGSTIGTPAYMSPEQCKAGELTGASDQYSLGVVAFEMLTGKPPFSGSPFEIMQAHTATPPPSIRDQRPDCPEELEAAVLRMMAKDPADRFADVAEAIEAIGGYLPGPQDPIRTDLAALVIAGTGQLPAQRDPLRPTPGRSTPMPPSRAAGERGKPGKRSRLPLWVTGAVVVITLATAGIVSWRSGTDDTPPVDPPVLPQSLPASSISFPNPSEEVLVGASVGVQASVADAEGTTLLEEAVSWLSDDPAIAVVRGTGRDAEISGVAPGTATISAQVGAAEGTLQVVVTAPAAGELSVSAPSRTVVVGGQLSLSAILTDQRGERVDDPDMRWSSSNSGVLSVDPGTGVVTGQALGRAEVRATSGDQSGSVSLSVVGRVDDVTINQPSGSFQTGGTAVLTTSVLSRPASFRGSDGVRWASSNPSVASVSLSGADSVVLTLLSPGETIVTVRAGEVQDAATIRVEEASAPVELTLSTTAVNFQSVEGGSSPEGQTVSVSVTGDADPSLGSIQYGPGESGWLASTLEAVAGGGGEIAIQADITGLSQGSYTASVLVQAGGVTRVLNVTLEIAENPETAPVEANAQANREISDLIAEYAAAVNAKNTGRVQELFPSLPRDAFDVLLGIPESDTYVLQLVPGSLTLGSQERTLEGDVLSSILAGGTGGEARRLIFTFGRGAQGWYIISQRQAR